MAHDRVRPTGDEPMPLANTELECKETTEGAETPPADKSARDGKCGAVKQSGSDGYFLDVAERTYGLLHHCAGKRARVDRV